jgi:FtsP/CotA-like multicopper oxidase with cupredoxin domain
VPGSGIKEAAMPDVKVRRTGIRADEASAAIKAALGAGYEVTQTGERDIEVRKNAFIRAKVSMSEEPGGTLFHVHGQGMPIPLLFGTMMLVNNLGIAKQITEAIGARDEFRDNA